MRNNKILKFIVIILIIGIIIIGAFLYYLINKENKPNLNNIDNISEIKYNKPKEKYECNEFKFTVVTAESLLNMYLNEYKNKLLMEPENAYDSLDKEYREKKFGSIDKFKKYINDNSDSIKQLKLNKYSIDKFDGYERYLCMDQYDNYYIFNVTAVMKYSVILDTYTIDLPEFTEKYNKASNIEKVGYNIQRCIDSINDKDYSYMYKKLDETFKNNNYKTEEIFENYIKNNLFENNIVDKNVSTSDENGIYVYNINVRNKDNINEVKALTIIMKLGEGTDFTVSFNIN